MTRSNQSQLFGFIHFYDSAMNELLTDGTTTHVFAEVWNVDQQNVESHHVDVTNFPTLI
jgi:hypothetical protein